VRQKDANCYSALADLGTQDHIHLLIERHPTIAEAQLAETLKTIISRAIRKEFREFLKPDDWKPVFGKRGYCAVSSGGASLRCPQQVHRTTGIQ
jgi:putative transposase